MKTNKRTLAILTAGLLAVTPMAMTGMTAFAATITVNKVTGDSVTHVYKAYPIITGTISGDKLTAMVWATGLDKNVLATALTAFDTAHSTSKFTSFNASTTSPEQFATMLEGLTDAQKEDLAKVFNTANIFTGAGTALDGSGSAYTATGLDDGWYVIKDETASLTGSARSANILEVRGDTPAITPKFSLPTLEKKIVDSTGANPQDANTAAIGDVVYYKISTEVPDMTGYNKYFFIVSDTLSSGLTYNINSLVVKYGTGAGTAFNEDTDGPIENADTGDYYLDISGGTIRVVFEDFRNNMALKSIAAGTPITITYNATLNSQANTSPTVGNPNTAKLIYSNDPNVTYTGTPGTTPDEPASGEPKGETPEDKVNTYTTAIKIKKVDQDGQPLKGATFKLTGANLKKVETVSGATFTEDNTNGTYWKLSNGSYTTTDPTTLTNEQKALYDSLTTKYTKTPVAALEQTAAIAGTDTVVSVSATVDDSGILTFTGLNAGDYTLEETGVPTGYNKADEISFTIGTSAINEYSVIWTNSNSTAFSAMDADNMFPTTITNRKGSILPTTGGIGTKLFYIIGGMLVAGSVVLLVTKKRMGTKED
ncbi:MAG: isopeptide-forming domain-containing fimbrial protein [Ruminococcus sp.]|uniref:isopeptide-forming domain-containing fimbrial protein n=1 Tax=Ruminococcus sp. TaxID=41978 RepID=UPI0025F6DFC7|nr:isopeptide-forming domain-containing fimbrial protein [Ruminococcus sp.]MBR5683473.1 isopeptide-forming domain-containing fimbrial protein [Ruminococcus sp.]